MAVRTAQTKLVGLIESLTEMQSKLVECSSSKQPDAPRLEFEPPNLATISDESSLDLGQIGPTIKKALVANHECLQRFRLDSSHLVFVCSHSIYCNVPTWASRQEHGPGAVAREDACADGWRELHAGARVSRCRCAGSSVERRRRLRVVRVEPHAVELIERSLQLDRDRLLARTRINRSGTRTLGLSASSEQMSAEPSRASHSQHQMPVRADPMEYKLTLSRSATRL